MPLIPALIGLFALSEAFVMIEQETVVSREGVARAKEATWADAWDGLRLAMKHWWETIWTALVGLVIGVTPGAGASRSEGRRVGKECVSRCSSRWATNHLNNKTIQYTVL